MGSRYKLWDQRDVNYMRRVQEANMPDTCVVERPTNISNGRGGYTEQFTTTYSGKCRFWISSGTSGTSDESRFWGEREQSFTEAFIMMPWDADVANEDRITWTHTETGAQRVVRVVGLNKHDSISTCTRARVIGIREPGVA